MAEGQPDAINQIIGRVIKQSGGKGVSGSGVVEQTRAASGVIAEKILRADKAARLRRGLGRNVVK